MMHANDCIPPSESLSISNLQVGTVTATGIEGLTSGVVSKGSITLFGYDMDTTIGRRMRYKCFLTDVSGMHSNDVQ